jgi:CRP-like cAMP-binding protein
LSNGVEWKKYGLGEFIIKEGEIPKGLYMIVKGQCIAGSQKLNIRSKLGTGYEKVIA